MTHSQKNISRRRFLQTSAATTAAATIIPAAALGRDNRPAPSGRISVGVVGLGSRGFNLIDEFLRQSGAQITAVCDVDAFHYRDQPWGKGKSYGRKAAQKKIQQYYADKKSGTPQKGMQVASDFRELCNNPKIDAIVVATPDHWHAFCTLEALRGGKDVYCEKPITHTFHEGQMVYREVARQKAVFQTGSQQRSDRRFHQAVELVLNGHIGKVLRVEVGLPPGYDKPQGSTKVLQPEDHLDYNFWCGPSAVLPYMNARHHRWWRGHRAYGGGVLMDWIGHHNDIAHWALGIDRLGPISVEAVGWTFPETDVYNTPIQYRIDCEYAGGITSSISTGNTMGTKLIGEDGWVYVNRGVLQTSDNRWTKPDFKAGPIKAYKSPGHTTNFMESVHSRQACICPAETGHRSITPGHLGYVSQAVGRKLRWDAKQEKIIGDEQANQLLHQSSYRKPWMLEG